MKDLGKGVSVDFIDHPYVFGIVGCDPIRIQKGKGRITGVSLEQLEVIIEAIKESADKPVVKEKIGKVVHGAIDGTLKDLEEAVKFAKTKEEKKAAKRKLKEYKARTK